MLFWFAGGTVVIVWFVFHSATLDYRLLIAGAVLPAVEAVTGHAWIAHTLLAPVLVMVLIMALTSKRRLLRRKWLCVPIGMFLHLVLDGVWARSDLFWWPLFGFGFGSEPSLEVSRGLGVNLVLEVLGVVALAWAWQRFGLADRRRRNLLVTKGHLDRALVTGSEAGM